LVNILRSYKAHKKCAKFFGRPVDDGECEYIAYRCLASCVKSHMLLLWGQVSFCWKIYPSRMPHPTTPEKLSAGSRYSGALEPMTW